MSLLLYEKAAENGQEGHDQRKDKDQSIAPRLIKYQPPQIGPEAACKVVSRNDKPCKKTNMGQAIKSSEKRGSEGASHKSGEPKDKSKNIESKEALVSEDQKK